MIDIKYVISRKANLFLIVIINFYESSELAICKQYDIQLNINKLLKEKKNILISFVKTIIDNKDENNILNINLKINTKKYYITL